MGRRSASRAAWQAELERSGCLGRGKEANRASHRSHTTHKTHRLTRTRTRMGRSKTPSRTAARVRAWPPAAGTGDVPAMLSVKKVPSMRGGNVLPLHAASYQRAAPSPSALPAPPMRWTAGPAGGPLPTSHARHGRRGRAGAAAAALRFRRAPAAGQPAAYAHRARAARARRQGHRHAARTQRRGGRRGAERRAHPRGACRRSARRAARCRRRARARSASTSLLPSAPRSRNRRGCGCRRACRRAGTRPRKFSAWHDRTCHAAAGRRRATGPAVPRPPRACVVCRLRVKTHTYGTLTHAQSPSRPFSPARPCARQ